MKHKITRKEYNWECGDGCCSEHGYDWEVDGKHVHGSPCEDSGWLAVLRHFGIDTELVGVDKDDEEIWSL